MQQSGQNTMPTTSLSMSVSSHGTGPGYSHTVPASQNVPMQGQGSIGNYVSRTNINMQSNPGKLPLPPSGPARHFTDLRGLPTWMCSVNILRTQGQTCKKKSFRMSLNETEQFQTCFNWRWPATVNSKWWKTVQRVAALPARAWQQISQLWEGLERHLYPIWRSLPAQYCMFIIYTLLPRCYDFIVILNTAWRA